VPLPIVEPWPVRVARLAGRVTSQTAGRRYALGRWVFLRALGLVYLVAFVSLAVQAQGLIGPDGILPAGDYLRAAHQQLGARAYYYLPTVFWLGSGAGALRLATGAGAVLSILLVLDLWPAATLALLWVLYLSLVVVGQDFLAFQWDALLLEAGVLAILLAPGSVRPRLPQTEPPALALVLVWWLAFRLMFESGVVKLTSGDPTWRHLTALDFHFFTQPLPTWTAWYAAHAPEWLRHWSVAGTLALEIGTPLLIWLGPVGRRLAFVGIVSLQALIFGTGNFAFFNLLTVALAATLLDDAAWRRILPRRLTARLAPDPRPEPAPPGWSATALGLGLLGLGTLTLIGTFVPPVGRSAPLALVDPLRSVNAYGLFRVMTTTREEIVIEGSDDGGETWRPYRFRFKPGDPARRPAFVEPHQPRLDWQMWFAALAGYRGTPWFPALMARLLEGSPPVLSLLASNPFPDHPPRAIRAMGYEYRFTTPAERTRTGDWWVRTPIGPFSPTFSLRP
jgi:lipase maturation factor 1